MPYTRKQLLDALRADHPEFKGIGDNKLFAAFAVDHPDIAKTAIAETQSQQINKPKSEVDTRPASEVLEDQSAAALKGMPKVITGLPGAVQGIGSIALKTLMGKDMEAMRDVGQMANATAAPFLTAGRGAAALSDPQMWEGHPYIQSGLLLNQALNPGMALTGKTVAPSQKEWESAADFAGTNLIASELPNAIQSPAARFVTKKATAATSQLASKVAELPGKAAELISPTPAPESALFRAIKPYARKVDFEKNLKLSMPRINDVVAQTGQPVTGIEDLLNHVKEAKKNVRTEYEGLKGDQQIDVDMTPVADAMEKSVTKKMVLEDPDAAQAIRDQAAKYRRTVPIDDAEDILRTTNAELESYYNKYPTARRKALSKNPDTALLDAQGQSLRQVIYDSIDPANGGAGARTLQKTYGSLMELEEEAYRRFNQSKRTQPESLAQQMAKIHAGGRVAGGVVGAGVGLMQGGAPGAALGALIGEIGGGVVEGKIANWLRARGETDSLIKSAFERFNGRSAPTVGSTPRSAMPTTGPAQLHVPRQLTLPPATGQTVIPSSGQTFYMPQNISLSNMADLKAYLEQQAGRGQMTPEAALAPQPGLLPGGTPLEAPSATPRWGTGSLTQQDVLESANALRTKHGSMELLPGGDGQQAGLGDRWHINRDLGAVEEDAAQYFLDGPDHETATAAIGEAGGQHYVQMPDGGSLGPFKSLEQAAKAAEQAIPQLQANAPLKQLGQAPQQLAPPKPQTLSDLLQLHEEPDWVSLKQFAKPGSDLLRKLSGKLRITAPSEAELSEAARFKLDQYLDLDDAMLQRSKAELPTENHEAMNAAGKETAEGLGAENRTANFRGGAKVNSPLADFEESPREIRRAIKQGKGELYDRILDAFKEEATEEWRQWRQKASPSARRAFSKAASKDLDR